MTPENKSKDPFITGTLIPCLKLAVLALIIGFCLHLGGYTAEQIWPTPPLTIEYKATK